MSGVSLGLSLGLGAIGRRLVVADPNFSDVLLLLGFEGTDGSTTTTDESLHGRIATFVGNAQIDTAQAKFGASSYFGDGTGDVVTFPDSADWNFAGEFTIECFFRTTSIGGNVVKRFITHYTSSVSWAWVLEISQVASAPGIAFRMSTGGVSQTHQVLSAGAGLLAIDTWYHLAVDRDAADTLRIYLDGAMKDKKENASGAPFDLAQPIGIGGASGGGSSLSGWIDEVRITGGVARYASDSGFTPPSVAFPRE